MITVRLAGEGALFLRDGVEIAQTVNPVATEALVAHYGLEWPECDGGGCGWPCPDCGSEFAACDRDCSHPVRGCECPPRDPMAVVVGLAELAA